MSTKAELALQALYDATVERRLVALDLSDVKGEYNALVLRLKELETKQSNAIDHEFDCFARLKPHLKED